MPIKGIQKARKPWVRPAACVLAVGVGVYEALHQQWLYVLVALLVVLACFFSKEHLITREGVDIQYTLFGKVSHNLWRWEEVTAIHVDRKRSMPNVALHIGKDVAIRLFVFTPKDAQAVLDLAKERNPAIRLGRVAGS